MDKVNKKDIIKEIRYIINGVTEYLHNSASINRKGYYNYSFSGDIYSDKYHWNVGSSSFALKLYYLLGYKSDNPLVIEAANYIKSFIKPNGQIYDKLVFFTGLLRTFLSSIKNRNYSNLLNSYYRRAETRQCYSSLLLFDFKTNFKPGHIPLTKKKVENYLRKLNWEKPWGAGSHFSHLLFFLRVAKINEVIDSKTYNNLIKYSLDWISLIQNTKDGAWYRGEPSLREKINGAMKIISGLVAIDNINFKYSKKLIDMCLSAVNDEHACDNFNIIYVLKNCLKLSGNYRYNEIVDFTINRFNIYKNHYHPKKKGFSFFEHSSNVYYYGAKITKGINEPDIHATTLFMWGISLIIQILDVESDVSLNEYKT